MTSQLPAQPAAGLPNRLAAATDLVRELLAVGLLSLRPWACRRRRRRRR
jgi:hypothetical protein